MTVLAAAQLAPASNDAGANLALVRDLALGAAVHGPALIAFPELSDVGYIPWPASRAELDRVGAYARLAARIPGPRTEELGAIARDCGAYLAVGLLEKDELVESRIFNTMVLIGPNGQLIGKHRKVHLSMVEKLYFDEGRRFETFATELGRVGMLVCYDALFPESARILALRGAETICIGWNAAVTSSSSGSEAAGVAPGYPTDLLTSVVRVRAFENTVSVVSACRVGYDPSARAEFAGFSEIVTPLGTSAATCTSQDAQVVHAEVLADLDAVRAHRPLLRDRRPQTYGGLMQSD